MLDFSNLRGQVLLNLANGEIRNNQGQALARTDGTRLLNLQDQVLAGKNRGQVQLFSIRFVNKGPVPLFFIAEIVGI